MPVRAQQTASALQIVDLVERVAPYHHFTVDVEEFFQVSAFERIVPRSSWDTMPNRVVAQTRRLLDMLELPNPITAAVQHRIAHQRSFGTKVE
jgi:hypothetical protein